MLSLVLIPLLLSPVQGKTETFRVGALTRQAEVFAPAKKSAHPPLVLAFHGHGGTGKGLARTAKIHELWPEALVVYPQGMPTVGITDPDGKKNGWQKEPGLYDDRDLAFVDAILVWAAKQFAFDEKRAFVMGHSNGARFTYVLWAVRGDRFLAYGPSGSPATGLLPRMTPASAFLIAGEKDPLVPFAGQKRTADALEGKLGTGEWTDGEGYTRNAKGKDGLQLGTYFHPGGHEYPSAGVRATIDFFKGL